MTQTKQEMLKKIYEVIADKTLSFGCRVVYIGCEYTISRNTGIRQAEYIIINSEGELGCSRFDKIIGHPVMIGDVLYLIEKKNTEPNQFIGGYSVGDINLNLLHLRTNKRKPIDDQSEECITFIYNLIKDATN